MWADKAGSDVPIVQQRKAGQSLMPPIFFPVKLCSRPYNITITNGGKIQDVESGGLGEKVGLQKNDYIVSLGTNGVMNNYLIDYLTISQAVVNEILKLPADDTCILIARGDDFKPYVPDIPNNATSEMFFAKKRHTYFYEKTIVNNGEIKNIRNIPIIKQLKLDDGGKVLQYRDLKLSEYDEFLNKKYALNEDRTLKNPELLKSNYGIRGVLRYGNDDEAKVGKNGRAK